MASEVPVQVDVHGAQGGWPAHIPRSALPDFRGPRGEPLILLSRQVVSFEDAASHQIRQNLVEVWAPRRGGVGFGSVRYESVDGGDAYLLASSGDGDQVRRVSVPVRPHRSDVHPAGGPDTVRPLIDD